MNPIKKFTTIFIIEKFGGGGGSAKRQLLDLKIFKSFSYLAGWFVTLRTHHLRADLSLNTGERRMLKVLPVPSKQIRMPPIHGEY